MTGPPDPLGALRRARREMQDALTRTDEVLRDTMALRTSYAEAVTNLDELIAKLDPAPVAPAVDRTDFVITGADGGREFVEVKRFSGFDKDGANTREAILWVLDAADQALEASEVVDAVKELGVDSKPASVRSLLSKMAESGQVDRPSRGLYQRAHPGPAPVRLAAHLRRRDSDPLPTLPTPEEFMALPPEPEDPDEPEPEFQQDYVEEDTRDYVYDDTEPEEDES